MLHIVYIRGQDQHMFAASQADIAMSKKTIILRCT